jgi:multiple sugar transport system ATP-binding protein
MVEPGTDSSLAAEVYVVEPLGNETLIALRIGADLINLRAAAGVNPAVGSACGVLPDPEHLHLFDAESGAAINHGQTTEGANHERSASE